MTDPNAALIQRFYEAFQRSDAEAMAACYAPDVQFSDPVFGVLRGREAADMWRMLLSRATEFSLTFSDIQTVGQTATANWVATYRFTPDRAQGGQPHQRAFRDSRWPDRRTSRQLRSLDLEPPGARTQGLAARLVIVRAEQDPGAGEQGSSGIPAATQKMTRLECPASEGCLNDEWLEADALRRLRIRHGRHRTDPQISRAASHRHATAGGAHGAGERRGSMAGGRLGADAHSAVHAALWRRFGLAGSLRKPAFLRYRPVAHLALPGRRQPYPDR